MTTAEDYENKTLLWWLTQLSLRQIWGLLTVSMALIGVTFSVGVLFGRQLVVAGGSADIGAQESDADAQQVDVVENLPDGLTTFDVDVLRILAEPHKDAVSTEYLAYRIGASILRVEGSLEKLAQMLVPGPTIVDRQIVYVIKTEGGDILSAIISQRGVQFMEEHKLFE